MMLLLWTPLILLKKKQQQKIKMASAQGEKIVQSTQDGLKLLSVPVISFQSAEINTFDFLLFYFFGGFHFQFK